MYWQVKGFKENSSVENWVNTGMTGNISRQKAIIVELLTTNLCWICPRTLIFPSSEICPLLFHNTEQYGWIQNPFLANVEISTQELSLPVRKCSTWWVLYLYWRGISANFESGFWNATSVLHNVLVWQISHLGYWWKTTNDQCLKEVDGEFRVALSKTERNVQRLCSLKQGQITQKDYEFNSLH